MKTKTINIKNQKIKYGINEEGTVYLFVYGTSNFKKGWLNFCADILCSLKCWKKKKTVCDPEKEEFKKVNFHAGAYEAAELILEHPGLLDTLQGRDVILGGMSMGGLVKAIGAILVTRGISDVQKCFGFGTYGICENESDLPFQIWNIIQGYDKVPLLFSKRFKQGHGEILPTLGKGSWPFRFYYDHVDYDYSCFWGYRL